MKPLSWFLRCDQGHRTRSIVSLWRYPVKSMMGEKLNAAEVGEHGVLGDRVYAVLDGADGKVASAKSPRKWPQMFECGGRAEPPRT
ncbi:MOSC N-terminal beta barrel domain-containing protein [Nonomuraea sp. NPDC049400]|uniref:MOSC N-terminal beta barrel domain-containing protein n=1 Tax=Nonomuraea sp. NPDC049400 TaxID=3364352 RepID=UPI003787B0F3